MLQSIYMKKIAKLLFHTILSIIHDDYSFIFTLQKTLYIKISIMIIVIIIRRRTRTRIYIAKLMVILTSTTTKNNLRIISLPDNNTKFN